MIEEKICDIYSALLYHVLYIILTITKMLDVIGLDQLLPVTAVYGMICVVMIVVVVELDIMRRSQRHHPRTIQAGPEYHLPLEFYAVQR